MADRIRIRCTNKTPRDDPWDRIDNVGGANADGSQWKLSEDEAIAGVENGRYDFYVREGGSTAEVIVATHSSDKYLKTEPDDEQPDNLLSLPECP